MWRTYGSVDLDHSAELRDHGSDATPPARAPKPSGSIVRMRIRMKVGKMRMRMISNFRILTFQRALKSAIYVVLGHYVATFQEK